MNISIHSRTTRAAPIVLLIEDEPGDTALIRWQLLERDENAFQVYVADSLAAARALFDDIAFEPDVVLLDLNLPDSTGVLTVERCRGFIDAPIVVLTGLDDSAAMRVAIESGAEDYLAKGGDATTLRRAIRYALLRYHRDADARLAATVFSHSREALMLTDSQGNLTDVNQTFTDMTGYSREEVIGRNPRFLASGRHSPEFFSAMWGELLEKGHWTGEVWNRRKNGEIFAEMLTLTVVRNVRGRVRHYVGLCSDITPQKEHEQQLKHIAHFDALTGLPNRVLVADRLKQAMYRARRSGKRLALAYIDLDGFKAINDAHGHDVGDRLLVGLAERMKQSLREGDTIARLGGDEFVAVLIDLNDDGDCEVLIQRLLASLAQSVQVDQNLLRVSGSIGVSFFPQQDEIDPDQLLRQADQAMYQAKLAGKNRYHVFDIEQDRSLRGQRENLDRIREGLEQGEFVLYYQPKVNMRTGAVIGVEALIRWQHPARGLLAPMSFLPLVAQHELEVDIGRWVIGSALTQIALWRADGLNLPVSVNIAGYHLQQADFVRELQDLLEFHPQVPRDQLELEVLESSALEDISHVSRVIDACTRLGVSVALDDFGTGYSSLTYLKRLPAKVLKIDQSFVRDMLHDPDDLAILEGVLGLAKAFRRDAIAEGVETVAHGHLLLQLGCELAQGYGIARPMPADEVPAWIGRWRPEPLWTRTRKIRPEALSVLHAGVEHRAWVQAMEAYLGGRVELPPELDPHQCRFGQWLDACAAQGEKPSVALEFGEIHRQMHALGDELIALHVARRADEVQSRLIELYALRDRLLAMLALLTE